MDFKSFKGILNINETAKKKLKITAAVTGGIFAAVYILFLIVPYFINLNNFIPMVSSEVEKISDLKLAADNVKLRTTFKFGIKLQADSFAINYKDNSPLFNLKNPEIELNIPTLLIGHINLDKIKADEAGGYLIFTKDKKYTVMEYVDNILKTAEAGGEQQTQQNSQGFNFPVKIQNINIKAGKIALHVIDENENKTYLTQLNNSVFSMKSLSGPVSFKTKGFVGIKDTDIKFANFDIDFKTKLPKITTNEETAGKKQDGKEMPELIFNPFKTLEDFNLKTDIIAKLDIKNVEDFRAKGNVDIQNFSLKLSDIQLPESYLNLNFKDRDIDINSKLFISNAEFIETKSGFRTGKKPKLNLDIRTDKIALESLVNIAAALLDICCVDNDIKNMTAAGYIKGGFNLDTNLKTIKSNGELRLVDGNISYANAGLFLSQMQAFLDFSNNALNIKDTSALVNCAKFSINGEIASNSDVNLNIKSDPLKIKDLINIATEFKLVNKKDIADFQFNNGDLTVLVNILGDFKNIQPKADVDINNFNMLVKSAQMPLSVENINIIARPKDKNDINAAINVKNVSASMQEPKLAYNAAHIKIAADMTNITLEPFNSSLEGTKINISGDIKNYMQNPELNIKVNGNVHPATVLAFIPKEFRGSVTHQGNMPYNATVIGALDNIRINGTVSSNPANYISVVEIPAVNGLVNSLNLEMAVKNDALEIDTISAKSSSGKLAEIKGQVKNIYAKEPIISNININIPNKTKLVIPMLGRASMNIIGNMSLSGKAFSPNITGNLNIDALNYPDYGLTLESLAMNFNKSIMSAKLDNVKVANSDFSGDANISTNFSKGIIINSLNYNSNYIDTDALIKLADKIIKTMPAPAQTASSVKNTQPQDLGATINTGNAKIAKLKSGGLIIEDINYSHNLLKNIYNLNNLNAKFAQGTASGKCSYNVLNGKIGVDMQAENIAMRDASKAFIGIDIVRSGTLAGSAKVSLSGATLEEQLRTLSGTVTFEVKDGEYGENISFAKFINAANVLNLGTFNAILNNVTSKVSTLNTQEFKNITGILTFNKGIAGVSNFKSQGPNMSLYASGTYNLMNNNANLKITGKVSSKVADVLGNLGVNKMQSTVEKVTTVAENTINKAVDNLSSKYSDNKAVQTGLAILGSIKNAQNTTEQNETQGEQKTAGQVLTSIIKEKTNPLFGPIPANDTANVPALYGNDTEAAKNFQVTILGPIAKPSSIKSLKFQNDGTKSNASVSQE